MLYLVVHVCASVHRADGQVEFVVVGSLRSIWVVTGLVLGSLHASSQVTALVPSQIERYYGPQILKTDCEFHPVATRFNLTISQHLARCDLPHFPPSLAPPPNPFQPLTAPAFSPRHPRCNAYM